MTDVRSAEGTITTVDLVKKTITGANDGGSATFAVTKDTKITADKGGKKTLADVRVGQNVRVTFTMAHEAVTIEIMK